MKTKLNNATRKATGSYYTSESVANFMCNYTKDKKTKKIIEPSFGDGVFLKSIEKAYKRKKIEVAAIEIQESVCKNYKNINEHINTICSDFLEYKPQSKVDLIIGNPPYISLRKIEKKHKDKIAKRIKQGLNEADNNKN